LLNDAVAEIVANCAAIANDSQIRTIRCDITSGLDSRIVLAAFLKGSPEAVAKIRLFTEASGQAPSPEDEDVALLVSAATGVLFSDAPDTVIGPCSAKHRAAKQVSATFGTYWHRGHGAPVEWDPTSVQVGGTGLDDVGRDYTTGSWKLVAKPAEAPEDISVNLAKQVFKWRGRASLKAAPRQGTAGIAAGWDVLPGDELEKGSQLFNFHRARFHGNGAIAAALGAQRMNPGPTRSLYRMRIMMGRIFTAPRVQLEILRRLNPELAAVPFGSAAYNAAYVSMFGDARTDVVPDRDQLVRARERRRDGRKWISCPDCGSGDAAPFDELVNLVRVALHDLGNDPLLYEVMLPAYRFASEHLGTTYGMNHSYGRTFANKVLHLHAMWRMTQSSNDEQVSRNFFSWWRR
jgi:hypothetical protein